MTNTPAVATGEISTALDIDALSELVARWRDCARKNDAASDRATPEDAHGLQCQASGYRMAANDLEALMAAGVAR